jgi:hypothetical protein
MARRLAGLGSGGAIALLACGAVASTSAAAPVAAAKPPKLVTAHRFAPKLHGVLKPGASVGSARLGVRVFPNASHGFALALVRNVTYPAATVDGGKSWKIDGPPLHVPAAQAPLVVTQVGAHKRTYFAWGGPTGGNVVDVTPDAGKHWFAASLGGLVLSVVATSTGHLIASVQAPTGAKGLQAANWVCVSRDQGRHWRLNTRFGGF